MHLVCCPTGMISTSLGL